MVTVAGNAVPSGPIAEAKSFLKSVLTRSYDAKKEVGVDLEESKIDLLAMPRPVRAAIASLNQYSPNDIGPLVAKEFAYRSMCLAMQTKVEVACSAAIGFLGTSILLHAASNPISNLTGLLLGSAVAAASGVAMWLYREKNGRGEERSAKLLGKMNYAVSPAYGSFTEALEASENAPQGSTCQLIALRHALTHVPLHYGREASDLAATILRRAESAFPGSLIHIDATIGLVHAAHPSMSRTDLLLLSRNVVALTALQKAPLDRIETACLRSDHQDRMAELRAIALDFTIPLFRMKFEDPRMKCDSLSLARTLLERPLCERTKAQDQTLSALRENCIEAYLGYVPLIPSPADRLLFLKEAAKIKGLDKDQKHLIASLIRGISNAERFTAAESAEADVILATLTCDNESTDKPATERREAA